MFPCPGGTVTCIACGTDLPRAEAWEYDKHGDRWERDGKDLEYFCKDCHTDLGTGDRVGLESLLISISAGEVDRDEFVARYLNAVEADAE